MSLRVSRLYNSSFLRSCERYRSLSSRQLAASFWGPTAGTVDSEGRILRRKEKLPFTFSFYLVIKKKEARRRGTTEKRKDTNEYYRFASVPQSSRENKGIIATTSVSTCS